MSSPSRFVFASIIALSFLLSFLGVACGDSPNGPPCAALPSAGGVADASADATDAATDAATDGVTVDGAASRSVGCGVPPLQSLAQYVKHTEVISGVAPAYAETSTNRFYFLRLPTGYDPERAYPLVLIGPGCGESGQSPIGIQNASGTDAIIVGMNGVNDCFNHAAADTPDLPYFDATLAEVEATTCVDTSRVFVTGFSSGSWLTSYLGCARGNVIRAQASVAGGLPPLPPTCTGPIPAMYVADLDDPTIKPDKVTKAVERVRVANGCGTDTVPYDAGVSSPCVQYQGCMPGYPLVYCETSGYGHSDQSTTSHLSTIGFWRFWTSLP
jgi:poly(3-hydroxybutyrate) depolymerase